MSTLLDKCFKLVKYPSINLTNKYEHYFVKHIIYEKGYVQYFRNTSIHLLYHCLNPFGVPFFFLDRRGVMESGMFMICQLC